MNQIPQDILHTTGSLTKALEAFYGSTADIVIISELIRPCTESESLMLEDEPLLWERQIYLCIDHKPIIFGLTRVAVNSLALFSPPLKDLGTQPLGYWLAAQGSHTLESLIVKTVSDSCLCTLQIPDMVHAYAPTTPVRESIHRVHNKPISIVELIMV